MPEICLYLRVEPVSTNNLHTIGRNGKLFTTAKNKKFKADLSKALNEYLDELANFSLAVSKLEFSFRYIFLDASQKVIHQDRGGLEDVERPG